ncbi:MAG: hypothetical protein J1E97_08725 [Muribaculaceae bacterium]|nr:hypothetical protein [Muribaculaceae bacterium]
MGKLKYNLEDFQKAAITFRKDLLRLPIIGLNDTMQYMTPRPGVTYMELVGTTAFDAQFAPYKAGRTTESDLDLVLRELRTYFGSVNADFEPNAEIQTLLGHKASQALGDAQAATPQAVEVLANIAKALSGHLNDAIFKAKRNPTGETTAELFDGFDTITESEVTGGGLSAENGNYMKLDKKIDGTNAVDVLKSILYKMSPILRQEECFLFCPYEVADAYNEAYLMSHAGIMYNDKYNQVTVEGSNNKLTIVPLASKEGSKYLQISPKRNMLVGFDQMSDQENVMVKEYKPDILTYCAKMFFGVQFESIDKRRLFVAELAD